VRIYFCLAIIFIVLWAVLLYLSNLNTPLVLFFNRAVYGSPALALLFFGLFIDASYPGGRRFARYLNIFSLIIASFCAMASLTSLNVLGLKPRIEHGLTTGYSIIPGRLAPVVGLILLLLSIALVLRIVMALRTAEATQRRPIKIILTTLLVAIFVSLSANVVAPLIYGGSDLANMASNIAVTIMVASMAYSALRYSFLDIRSYVSRAVVYLFTITIIALMYTAIAALLVTYLLNIKIGFGPISILSLITAVVAVSFNPLKDRFNRITNRLFFRDYYDPQDLLDNISSLLVGTVDIDIIRSRSAAVLGGALKSSFVKICLVADKQSADDRRFLEELLKTKRSEIITDDIDQNRRGFIYNGLKDRDVAIAIKLKTTHGDLGFILFGFRKSGVPYSAGDRRLLGIITDELAVGLQNALRFEEIEQFNVTLQQKVEEATRKLRKTNERLRVLDQTKDDFISMASHQLRTPLTSVKGYVSMVLDGDAGKISELQRKLLTQSFLSSQRMVYLISDLLNVSRLKTGKFVIEPVESNLANVIEEEVEQLVETVKSRGLELKYHKPEHFPTLMIDETKLRQVIMNFIDNAIYYTPSGGHIDVYLVDKPESIEFTVVDDGIGVPKHEQHHLFSKFYRAKNAKTARPDGTGLGIFMAKKVIIAQGGAVIFKSAEGKGSTFGFTFPKAPLLPKDIDKK
jgi:signal transduction histidine kinase